MCRGLVPQLTLCCHMRSIAFVFDICMRTAKRETTQVKPLRIRFGGAAQATNVYAFDHHIQKIYEMDKGAHTYLSVVAKQSWSRNAFNCQTKSDILLNNLAKSFNAWIKESRSKPILTMLEDICRQIMARFQQKMNGIRLTNYIICQKIQKKLEKSKSDAMNCISHWQNEQEFEMDHMCDARHIVKLDQHTCTCGRWQLNAIPCPHAYATIYMHKQKLEDYLDACYTIDKYMEGYAPRVFGVEGPNTWPANDLCVPIMPLIVRRAPGKLKIARRREADEPTNLYKLTRSGFTVKYGNCGRLGHNYKGCKQPLNPDWKRWKPKKYKSKKDGSQAQPGSKAQV